MQGRTSGRSVLLAYRVYPDGHEELVRGARLVDVGAQSFKDIVAVSSAETIYHRPALSAGNSPIPLEVLEEMGEDFGSAMPLASYVVPSLLFEDLSLERALAEQPKPPLSAPPGG